MAGYTRRSDSRDIQAEADNRSTIPAPRVTIALTVKAVAA
jgi:hypothetical protein